MVSSNNAINNTIGASISGVTNTLTVTNSSNTASSAARETIVVGGGSAGDPTLNWNVSGVTNFEMGLDNSDSDKLKISQGTALGTNDTWIMDTSGRRTMPLQPCFSAFLPSDDLNVTGDGTFYTLGSGTALTILTNQGSNFTSAGVFTAPVTGNYLFSGALIFYETGAPFGVAYNQGRIDLVTTSKRFVLVQFHPYNFQNAGGGSGTSFCFVTPMTAGETCTLQGSVAGGAKIIDVRGGAVTGASSCFSGFLVC